MKHQISKVKAIVFAIVLTAGVLALSSCNRSGCPGLITKVQPVEKTIVRS